MKYLIIFMLAASSCIAMEKPLVSHSARKRKKAAAKKPKVTMCLSCGKHIFVSIAQGNFFKIDGNWFHAQCPTGSK